jgi:outer membrane lipoprotein SlyB
VGTQSGLDTAPVVGTVAQFQFGGGKSEGWSFGAAGTPEMQTRLGETYYELTVAMDSGEKRTVERKDGNRFHVGQRVALRAGELEPM